MYAEIIPCFEQRLEMGRVYPRPCAKSHGHRQLGGAILLQQRVQHAGYPHTHITPTERPRLCLWVIWRRGQTLQAFVALGKLVTPLQAAFAAPDCAGGLDKRTQYRRITLCTLRHRSFSSRCVHSMTSRAPPPSCFFGNLGDRRYSGQGRCGRRAWWASGDPAPRQGPRQRPVTGRVQLQGAHPRRR